MSRKWGLDVFWTISCCLLQVRRVQNNRKMSGTFYSAAGITCFWLQHIDWHRPLSPKALESCRLSKLTSSASSLCTTRLFHPIQVICFLFFLSFCLLSEMHQEQEEEDKIHSAVETTWFCLQHIDTSVCLLSLKALESCFRVRHPSFILRHLYSLQMCSLSRWEFFQTFSCRVPWAHSDMWPWGMAGKFRGNVRRQLTRTFARKWPEFSACLTVQKRQTWATL